MSVSDLHFSHTAPIARSAEPDWYLAQKRSMIQLRDMWKSFKKPTMIYCGDVFHTSKEPARLVNLVLKYIPPGYAICGQHDLDLHNYEDIKNTPYWTLVEAGKITNLEPGKTSLIRETDLLLYGFPWGTEVTPCPDPDEVQLIKIAVIHAYIWKKGKGHEKASASHLVEKYRKKLIGYDIALFGDNHTPLSDHKPGQATIINNGAFQPRRADEINLTPKVTLIYKNGTITYVSLDTDKNKWLDKDTLAEEVKNAQGFESLVDEISALASQTVDFLDKLKGALQRKGVKDKVKTILREVIDEVEASR